MRPSRLLPVVLSAVFAASSARAELQSPGSLLVFPLADARAGSSSVLTVTNVNLDSTAGLNVEFVYVVNCLQFNRTRALPAGDSVSVLLASDNPGGGQGFSYVFAKDALGRAVSANHLVGSVLVVDGAAGLEFQVPGVAFASPRLEGALTDLDGDGIRDLDGNEYARVAEDLLFPRFLGQSTTYNSELVLVNLTGGAAFTATVNVLVSNDDRDVYAAQYAFRCWSRVRLSSISPAFTNSFLLASGQNPSESALGRETGWFSLDGTSASSSARQIADPALLAVLIEPSIHSSASLPFGRGVQDNGDLYPTSAGGDSNGLPGSGNYVPPNGGILGN
jgi:hypothetical protein